MTPSDKHLIGQKKCPECCCGGYYIHEICGGRWHERLVDDTIEEGFIHNYRCDKCFQEDYHHGYDEYKIEFEQ